MPRIEYNFVAKDGVTPEVTAMIAKMKELGITVDEVAKKEGGLSSYRKAQLKEMKDYRFVVNEAKDAIGGMSIAVGFLGLNSNEANGSIKSLSNAVNSGFAGFQAADAITGALGNKFAALAGPIGIAISLGAALAGIIASIASESEKTKVRVQELTLKTLELKFALGSISSQEYLTGLVSELARASIKFEEAKKPAVSYWQTLLNMATGKPFNIAVDIDTEAWAKAQNTKLEKETAVNKNIKDLGDKQVKTDNDTRIARIENSKQVLLNTSRDEVKRLEITKNAAIEKLAIEQKAAVDAEKDEGVKKQITSLYAEKRKAIVLDYNKSISDYAKDQLDKYSDLQSESYKIVTNLEAQKLLVNEKNSLKRIEIEATAQKKIIENEKQVALAKATTPEAKRNVEIEFTNKINTVDANSQVKTVEANKQAADKVKAINETLASDLNNIGLEIANANETNIFKKIENEKNAALETLQITQQAKIDAATSDEEKYALMEDGIDRAIGIENRYNAKTITAKEDVNNRIKQLGIANIKDNADRLNAEEKAELDKADRELAGVENLEQLKDEIRKKYSKQRTENELKSGKDTALMIMDTAKQMASVIGQFASQDSEAKITALEKEKESRLGAIDAELEGENLSEDQRKKLLEERKKIETDYNNQVRAEKERQWKADKEAKTIMAIIDTAAAVVKALPDPVLAVLAGVMGAAQVALIASQPMPKFHSGGTVGKTFFNESPNKEFPVLVRGGETIRTEQQEAALSKSYVGGNTYYLNFPSNAPTDAEYVMSAIKKVLVASGQPIEKVFVTQHAGITLG
jgi:hypothetical protein